MMTLLQRRLPCDWRMRQWMMTLAWTLLLLTLMAQKAGAVTTINVPTYEAKPKYYAENGTVKGLCIDILHAIEQLEPSLKFIGWDQQVPLPRIEMGVQNGTYDMMLCSIKTAERSASMVLIDTPIFKVYDALVVRKNDTANPKSLDDIRKLGEDNTIMVLGGTSHAKFLATQQGINFDQGANGLDQLFGKLAAKRGRFVMLSRATAVNYLHQIDGDKTFKILPHPIRTEGRYFYFSKKVPPEVVKKVSNALNKLVQTGKLKEMMDQYTLE